MTFDLRQKSELITALLSKNQAASRTVKTLLLIILNP